MYSRLKCCCCLVIVLLSVCSPINCWAEITILEGDGENEPSFTYHMNVTSAPADVPVLKHRLIAKRIDLKPGNAAPYYSRGLLAMAEIRKELEQKFGDADILREWTRLPTKDLPLDDIRQVLGMFRGNVNDNFVPAVEKRKCDWQWGYEDLRGPEIFDFSPEELPASRQLMRMLHLLARLDIANGQHDSAVNSIRMSFRISSDLTKEPLLVCGLISIASAGIANDSLLELIAAPNSPNMYWPLAALPTPPIPLRRHVQSELEMGLRMFLVLEKANSANWSADEWNEKYRQTAEQLIAFTNKLSEFSAEPQGSILNAPFAKFIGPSIGVAGYRHAKQRLAEIGYEASKLEAMPVGQVLSIYSAHAYQRCADGLEMSWCVPFWKAQEIDIGLITERTHPFGAFEDREILPIASLLLPILRAARVAEMRITRDVAALRVIEALRMHAAENEERLPASLKAIECVYVPKNPATGKPFLYHLEEGTAILDLPSEDGTVISRRFIMSIAKEAQQ